MIRLDLKSVSRIEQVPDKVDIQESELMEMLEKYECLLARASSNPEKYL